MTVFRVRPGTSAIAPSRADARIAGITVSASRVSRFQLPYGVAVEGSGVSGTSADGDRVLTYFGEPSARLIGARNGSFSRPIGRFIAADQYFPTNPTSGRFIDGQPDVAFHPFASTLIAIGRSLGPRRGTSPRLIVEVLDSRTMHVRRSGLGSLDLRSEEGPRLCFLPTGRSLLEVRRRVANAGSRVAITDARGQRFTTLETSRRGVTSLTCDAAAAGRVFATGSDGTIYELAASELDGSALE
jgi:hypothetical protein